MNRDAKAGGYWDYPLERITPDEADLSFIAFFDFDVLGHRDFKYVRVRMSASNEHSEIVGRDALVDAEYVKIALDGL